MKKIIIAALLLLLPLLALAGQGIPVWNETVTLYSLATGTTGTVTTPNANFANTVQNIGCTVYSSPTASVTVQFFGTAATGTGYVSLATATTFTTPGYVKLTGNPVNSMNENITTSASNTAAVITTTCTGLQ